VTALSLRLAMPRLGSLELGGDKEQVKLRVEDARRSGSHQRPILEPGRSSLKV
jgi:hypothetical protein